VIIIVIDGCDLWMRSVDRLLVGNYEWIGRASKEMILEAQMECNGEMEMEMKVMQQGRDN